jgi:Leucine-rich repeat (LRR) protein
LKKLDLIWNPIEKLESNWFSGLNNLEELDLERCRIKRIAAGAFNGLKKLKKLVMTWNPIDLKPNMFPGLKNLEIVYDSYY